MNADKTAARLFRNPTDARFQNENRLWNGCPTIAFSKGGRMFVGWYSGGDDEPSAENFNILRYSDDNGKTWSGNELIIDGLPEECIQAIDIELFTDNDGRLFVFWQQDNYRTDCFTEGSDKYRPVFKKLTGYFEDHTHACWYVICENPDADKLVFSEPKYAGIGFLRNKPLILRDGRWILPAYSQESNRYSYLVSEDNGNSFTHHFGSERWAKSLFDETAYYQMNDGRIRMFARTVGAGFTAESYSSDGRSWTETALTDIPNANTRMCAFKTKSGAVILGLNDSSTTRCRMSVWLSDDDGKTWNVKRLIDARNELSYPDIAFYGDRIYMVYDRERGACYNRNMDYRNFAREILLVSFTEEDLRNPEYEFQPKIVDKVIVK